MTTITDYIDAGWKLCAIPPGEKGPTGTGWNDPANAVSPERPLPDGWNVGLMHSLSGTATLDVDSLPEATAWLAERGVDLQALLDAEGAVQIVSGRPDRAKLLFALPSFMAMPTKRITANGQTILEFRCCSANGSSTQCVLPPSRHPSGSTYQWGGKGNWRKLPSLPPELLTIWQGLLKKDAERNIPMGNSQAPASLDEIRSAVFAISPDCSRQVWVEVGMGLEVLGEQSGDPAACFELFDTWSAGSATKYNAKVTRQQWRSFEPRPDGIGIGTIFFHAQQSGWKRPPPDVSELFKPVQQEQPMPELKPIELDPAIRKQINDCVSMPATLLYMGYAFPNAAGEWIRYKGGKATQQGDCWTIDGVEGIDAAAAFVAIGFAGDTAAAEATWREWAKDSSQMAWFYNHRDGSGAYGVQSMLAWQTRNDTPPQPHPLTVEYQDDNAATEFVIDGMVCEGFVVLAADRGTGKSTATVALACKAAWLCPDDDPLRPIIRRQVVYVTEHPQQVSAIIGAMLSAGVMGSDGKQWRDWIHIVPAMRMRAEDIVKAVPTYLERYCSVTERNGVSFNAPPWVVYDTASAVIKLDEENGNTDISDAVATLKQAMLQQQPPVPFLVVGHVAKAIRHASVESMTMRGGGAWEGDAYQVMYLSTSEGPTRYFEVGHPNAKRRFDAKWYAIEVIGIRQSRLVRNRFGEIRVESTWWASLTPVDEADSQQSKQAKKDAAEVRRVEEAKRKMRDWFEQHPNYQGAKGEVIKALGIKNEIGFRAICELSDEGFLLAVDKYVRKDGKNGSNGIAMNPNPPWGSRSQVVPAQQELLEPHE